MPTASQQTDSPDLVVLSVVVNIAVIGLPQT